MIPMIKLLYPKKLKRVFYNINPKAGKQFCPKVTDDFISLICGNNNVPVILLRKNNMEREDKMPLKIGLIDVDSHNFPNLPLMKLSAYH